MSSAEQNRVLSNGDQNSSDVSVRTHDSPQGQDAFTKTTASASDYVDLSPGPGDVHEHEVPSGSIPVDRTSSEPLTHTNGSSETPIWGTRPFLGNTDPTQQPVGYETSEVAPLFVIDERTVISQPNDLGNLMIGSVDDEPTNHGISVFQLDEDLDIEFDIEGLEGDWNSSPSVGVPSDPKIGKNTSKPRFAKHIMKNGHMLPNRSLTRDNEIVGTVVSSVKRYLYLPVVRLYLYNSHQVRLQNDQLTPTALIGNSILSSIAVGFINYLTTYTPLAKWAYLLLVLRRFYYYYRRPFLEHARAQDAFHNALKTKVRGWEPVMKQLVSATNHSHPHESSKRALMKQCLNDLKARFPGTKFYEIYKGYHSSDGFQPTVVASDHARPQSTAPRGFLQDEDHFYDDPLYHACDVVILILSDWYVDLSQIAASRKPMFIITKENKGIGYSNSEMNCRPVGDNKFRYVVRGGALYEHKMHRFDQDFISFDPCHAPTSNVFLRALSYLIPTRDLSNVYSVERFPFGEIDTFVFLLPTRQSHGVVTTPKHYVFNNTYEHPTTHDRDVVLQVVEENTYKDGREQFLPVLYACHNGSTDAYKYHWGDVAHVVMKIRSGVMDHSSAATYLQTRGNKNCHEIKYFLPYIGAHYDHIHSNSYVSIIRGSADASVKQTLKLPEDKQPLPPNLTYDQPITRTIRDTWYNSTFWTVEYLATTAANYLGIMSDNIHSYLDDEDEDVPRYYTAPVRVEITDHYVDQDLPQCPLVRPDLPLVSSNANFNVWDLQDTHLIEMKDIPGYVRSDVPQAPVDENNKPTPTKLTRLERTELDQLNDELAQFHASNTHFQRKLSFIDSGPDTKSLLTPGLPIFLPPHYNLTIGVNTPEANLNAIMTRMSLVHMEETPIVTMCPVLRTLANAWAVLAADHHVVPINIHELRAHFTTTTQKKRYDEYMTEYNAVGTVTTHRLRKHAAFVKAEPYQKEEVLNRNISAVSTKEFVEMSCYTIPVSKSIKELLHCFGFQYDNATTGEIIHKLARTHKTCVASDYSKFDGRQNSKTHMIDSTIITTIVHADHRLDISRLLRNTLNNQFVCDANTTYNANYTRQSGSALTSLGNTLINASITFLARIYTDRNYDVEYSFLTEDKERILRLYNMQMCGGDDGIAYDVDLQAYEGMVKYFDLQIDLDGKNTSDPVNFLARVYPSPATDPGSSLELPRFLQRFMYVNSNPTTTTIEALRMKTESMLVTEGSSNELLTGFASMLLRVLKAVKYSTVNMKNYSFTNYQKQALPMCSETYQIWLDSQDPELVQYIKEISSVNTLAELGAKTTLFYAVYTSNATPTDHNKRPKEKMIEIDLAKQFNAGYANALTPKEKSWVTSSTISKSIVTLLKENSITKVYDVTPGPGGFAMACYNQGLTYLFKYSNQDEMRRYTGYPHPPAFLTNCKQFTEVPPCDPGGVLFVDLPFPNSAQQLNQYMENLHGYLINCKLKCVLLTPTTLGNEIAAKYGMTQIYTGTTASVLYTDNVKLKVVLDPTTKSVKTNNMALHGTMLDAIARQMKHQGKRKTTITRHSTINGAHPVPTVPSDEVGNTQNPKISQGENTMISTQPAKPLVKKKEIKRSVIAQEHRKGLRKAANPPNSAIKGAQPTVPAAGKKLDVKNVAPIASKAQGVPRLLPPDERQRRKSQ
jgi:hypothetical protein